MKRKPKFHAVFQDQLSDYITAIAWASDHRLFAISAAGEVVQWQCDRKSWTRSDLNPTPIQADPSLPPLALNAIGISSNGQYLAVGGQAGTLIIWDLTPQIPEIIHDQTFRPAWLDQLAWHPSEAILAIGVGKTVHLWHCFKKELLRVLQFESSTILNLAWHPNGHLLAAGGHGGVKVWDLESPASPELLAVPGASLCTKWSPDGKFLASGNLDRTLSVIDYGHPPPWLMQGFPGKVNCITWGRILENQCYLAAAASDGITIWTQKDNLNWQNTVLMGHEGLIRDMTFQPNRRLLATAGDEAPIRLWHAGQNLQQSLKGPLTGTHCLAWNQSGIRLASGGTDGSILIFESDDAGKGFS